MMVDQQQTILSALRSSELGLPVDDLKSRLPGLTQKDLMEQLNDLVEQVEMEYLRNQQEVELLHQQSGKLIFKARIADEARKLRNMTDNERIVYQFVKDSGNKGTWIKHIKDKSGLHSKIVTDTIAKLEKKSVIKSVKAVKNPTKKLYMLFELDPSSDLTGGNWYTDSKIDTEFIDQLASTIHKYIQAKSSPHADSIFPSFHQPPTSVEEIHEWIKESNLTSAELSLQDIEALVNRLVFDGSVYKVEDIYKSCFTRRGGNALMDSPCGACSVFAFCKSGGPVNPASCVYLTKWLEF